MERHMVEDAEAAPNAHYRLALVDDHEIVAVAFEATLAGLPAFEYVGIAPTVDDLLARFTGIDLVVLDLRLADGSSPVSNVKRIMDTGSKVLAYTSGENPYLVRAVAKTDVLGIVRKSEPVAVLAEALQLAAAGKPVVSTEWAAAIDSDPALERVGLSAQEQKVLTLFANGNKAQAVASAAGIALGTVDDYVRRIRAKYTRAGRPAHTKIDLYKRAIEDGFLPIPGTGAARDQ
jgi:DNA-binding NarL/FixJ family response regulator